MDNSTVRLSIANVTDIGKIRVRNEDCLGRFEGEYGTLLLVCDGIGGHPGGEFASRIVVESIKSYFDSYYLPGEELATIGKAVDFAQQKILEAGKLRPDLEGMGSTLVLLLIKQANFWYAHSGDSRLYLARGESLNRLSKDHSEVQALVDDGVIPLEQASSHHLRHILTKALGLIAYLPDISGPHLLQQDDVFLLCSDGLTEHVPDAELLTQLEEEPQIACKNLVELALERGGTDNITLQIVHVLQSTPYVSHTVQVPPQPKKSFVPHLAVFLTILAFLAALTWYMLALRREPELPVAKPVAEKKAEQPVTKEKDQKQPQVSDLTALETALDQKLKAEPADAASPYRILFDKLRDPASQAKTLKFFANPTNNQVVYILPGNAIYLAYNKLQEKSGYNMSREQIEALITIALLKSAPQAGTETLDQDNWQSLLFAPGTAGLDTPTIEAAKTLYRKFDPKSDGLMFSQRFMGKYKNLFKAGDFNIAIAPPQK